MKTVIEIRRKKLQLLADQYGSLKLLSEKLDKSPAQLSQWKNGSKNSSTGKARGISDDMARHIESKCGKPVGWLDNDSGHSSIGNVSAVTTSKSVPLVSWIQAGEFCDNGSFSPLDETTQYYPCPVSSAGPNTFALRVKGDSMTASFPGARSYPEGSIIYIDPDAQWIAGSRVIARLGDETTFKQVMEKENGSLYLKPLNDRHPLIIPDTEMQICGLVIGSFFPE